MEGWKNIPLQDACELFTDGDWVETKDQSLSGIRLIQTGNVGQGHFKDRRDKARHISSDTFDQLKCTEVFPGDCLVSRLPDPPGRSCIIPETEERMITAVDCTVIRFDSSVCLPEFFNYLTQSRGYLKDVDGYCTGATRRRISRKNLGKVKIPLPPLPEQERIVAILDEAFAAIETATANAEKNIENARELFESQLERALSSSDSGDVVMEGWESKTLNELCEIARGGSPRPIKEFITDDPNGINWIKIGDATASAKYISETKQKIKPEGVHRSRMVHPGDFILSNSMSFGRPYIMQTSGCIHDGWLVLSDKSGLFNQDYLYHFLGSTAAYQQFDSRAAGSTVRNLNIDLVRTVEVPLPPLPEQERIVAILDGASERSKQLKQISTDKLEHLSNLKQSLLHKAFTGELTADKKAADQTLSEAGV